jgi:predicted O-methyltransferase YrrM
MSHVDVAGGKRRAILGSQWLKPTFTSTLLLSACLLFLVQPLFARMAMPLLGGTPAVWAIAMCFFQGVLLAGYIYAHLLRKFATPMQAVVIHSLMLFAAMNMLPFTAPVSSEPINGIWAGITLLWLYTKSIGFPFFALSATAPLLQSWFGRTEHPQAANPYFLYAASNIGSIGALFIYPLLIEPIFGLDVQTHIWTFLFALLVVAITICGHLHMRFPSQAVAAQAEAPAEDITAGRRFYWIVMSFIPSAMLVAWTNHVSADIASAPFLWLPPLVMFLLTFVLEFRDKPAIPGKWLMYAQILFVPLAMLHQGGIKSGSLAAALAVGSLAFFVSALICHRQLYNSRPSVARLTEFYMLMSVGGVLGGLFVSIISPLVFSSSVEYPLLLITALLLRQKLDPVEHKVELPFSFSFFLKTVVIFTALAFLFSLIPQEIATSTELALVVTLPLTYLLVRNWRMAVMAAVVLPAMMSIGRMGEIATIRNYFGVLGVANSFDGVTRDLRHGTTLHGAQLISQIAPDFPGRPIGLTYYTGKGGIGRALRAKQDLLSIQGKNATVGIVGLGVGAMTCMKKANEDWTYFEIDPDMIRIASNPDYFTYIAKCGEGVRFVEGDARLTLQKEPAAKYDYLLIDAFSSDSIPTHLLTVEAMKIYYNNLKPDGVLVYHLSNRFMDLPPFVAATVAAADPTIQNRLVMNKNVKDDTGATASLVLVTSRDGQVLDMIDKDFGSKRIMETNLVEPWTDNFTNNPAAIIRMMTNPTK